MALDHESRLAFNVPAKIANRMAVSVTDSAVRIAFAEAAPGETRAFLFHTAVLMSASDARGLRDLLVRLVPQ